MSSNEKTAYKNHKKKNDFHESTAKYTALVKIHPVLHWRLPWQGEG